MNLNIRKSPSVMFVMAITALIDMFEDTRGQLQGSVLAIVATAITILVGVITYESVSTSINRGSWSAAANSSFTTVTTNTFSGFNLAAVGIIVLAAIAILGIIFALAARTR